MSPAPIAVTALFAAEPMDDLFAFPGILKLAGLILGILSPLLGATWWLASKHYRATIKNLLHQVNVLQDRVAHLEDDHRDDQQTIDGLRKDFGDAKKVIQTQGAELTETKRKLMGYYKVHTKLKPAYDQAVKELTADRAVIKQLQDEVGNHDAQVEILRKELERRIAALQDREQKLNRIELRIRRALRLDGNLWTVKALQKVPKFRPLAERNRAIVSVLNLKGGVGKTTVTAQLGVALARRGYRVLMVDLDLQGSLTNLFLPFDKTSQLAADSRLLQHFLKAAATDHTVKLLDYTITIDVPGADGRLGLVPTSDHLAYAELSLTLQWLLRHGERDSRFLLRKALHLKSLSTHYDVVLLDCPPLVNIACANALAASDYVLIPASVGRRVMERVPVLLQRFLKSPTFQKNVNHDLKVLGVLANRTQKDHLTGPEQGAWKLLGDWCRDAIGHDVKQFGTVIPQQTKDIREAETTQSVPDPSSKLALVFAALAAEVEQELPNECRRSAKAPV